MADRLRSTTERPLQVSELTRYLKYVVESDELLGSLSVQGEICELSRSGAGHVYFALKDETSQISCVLFRREAAQQADEVDAMRKGLVVTVHGFFTVYEPRGTWQVYVQRVQVQGEGQAFRRFEALKRKLEAEGLFASERKRALPLFPHKIALLTAAGSQAYHDVIHRLKHQYPFVSVVVAPVAVQGDHAPGELVMAIDLVNRLTDADVILIVRGGGSPEDLAAFNDERLARAAFASRIPIVSGVGHEQDYSILDFVADYRAATPSLAAAAAVPDSSALIDRAAALQDALGYAMDLRLRADRSRWMHANRALLRGSPESRLREQRGRLLAARRAGHNAIAAQLRAQRARVSARGAQLAALDPLAILGRGYAMLSDPLTGQVVARTEQAEPGRTLRAQVSDGSFAVEVTRS